MTPLTRRHLLVGGAALAGGAVLAAPPAMALPKGQPPQRDISRDRIRRWANDTWRSLVAMTDEVTGLTADNIEGSLINPRRSGYTSPTNIGGYLWSALVARDLRIISAQECSTRLAQTLSTLATMRRNRESGMYYNWYDERTGAVLTTWPVDGSPVNPFLSSVDNGWLATGLQVVIDQVPALRKQAHRVLDPMDFGYYYDPAMNQIRGGFWVEDPTPKPGEGAEVPGNYRGGETVYYTGHHYGAFNTEPRMASYLGIAAEQIPQKHYFGTFRTFQSENCDYAWTEQRAVGHYETYLGQRVFEGSYGYRGMRLVPTWGGSMFEALMVPLFVPEERWGPQSWALNHPTYVKAQIEHGMAEAGYGYWGFSPSNNPAGGYREYGVDPIGMEPNGYASDQERTYVDYGYGDCPNRAPQPEPAAYGQGVVTPHASFIAYRYAPDAALENLANLREDFEAYGPGGFYDAVNVTTGQLSERYLSLDQGMVMAALGNALADDVLRHAFAQGPMEQRVAPLMRMEEFSFAPSATP